MAHPEKHASKVQKLWSVISVYTSVPFMKPAYLFAVLCLSCVFAGAPSWVAAQSTDATLVLIASALPNAPLPQPRDEAVGFSSSLQEKQTPDQTAREPQTDQDRKAEAQRQLDQEEKQRMLGIIPSFNSVMGGSAPPLTARQKYHLWFRSATDPFQFVAAGLDAGLEQAENEYPDYHQGLKGYAKRYGASYADSVDGNFWGNAVLPALFHQDPRYFRLGHGSFQKRVLYTVLSTVRCKGDNGKWQFSYSNIGGNFIGGAISNLYYPASDRGVALTLERGFTVTAEGAIGSLAFEFYPDAIAFLKRHHHSKSNS
jgi:hypothetical protein